MSGLFVISLYINTISRTANVEINNRMVIPPIILMVLLFISLYI